MTTIGVYKPCKPILFNDDDDTASWSLEIVNFCKIMAKHGHEVYICSTTDYDNSIKNIIKNDSITSFDYLVVFNGAFSKNLMTEDETLNFYKYKEKYLFCTDLTLCNAEHNITKYSKVFSQSKKIGMYAHLDKLYLYGKKLSKITQKSGILFFGNERNRLKGINEYVVHDGVEWIGKSKTYGFNNFISKSRLEKKLDSTKYSIIISDDLYYENNFVTQRYWECLIHNIIPFVHYEYDNDGLLVNQFDYRRVMNYSDMMTKIESLEQNAIFYTSMLKQQQKEIKKSYLNGQFVYDILKLWFQ